MQPVSRPLESVLKLQSIVREACRQSGVYLDANEKSPDIEEALDRLLIHDSVECRLLRFALRAGHRTRIELEFGAASLEEHHQRGIDDACP